MVDLFPFFMTEMIFNFARKQFVLFCIPEAGRENWNMSSKKILIIIPTYDELENVLLMEQATMLKN